MGLVSFKGAKSFSLFKPCWESLSVHHQFNTLIITYQKPAILCEMEAQVLLLLKNVETETDMDDLLKGLMAK